MKKKKIILISIISIFVLGLIITGIYFLVESNKPTVKFSGDSEYSSDTKEITDDTKDPSNYDVEDVIAMTLWRMSHTNRFKVSTSGISDAGITKQNISNTRYVVDNQAFIRCITSGIVKEATERFFNNETVLIRKTNKINNMVPSFSNKDPECITYDDYLIRYGWLPFQATGYIISRDTYLETPTIEKKDDNYVVMMKLDPNKDKAPFYYKREVATNASSTSEPIFKSIEVTWIINSSYYILESNIKEEYSVKAYGINATSKTNCTDLFEYNNIEMPKEIIDYYSQFVNLVPSSTPDILNTLSIITSTFLNKSHSLNLNIDVNDNKYEGKIYLDLEDLNNIKFKALLNDDLYIEYNDILYFDYFDNKFKFNLKDLDLNFDNIIQNDSLVDQLLESKIIEENNNYDLKTNIDFSENLYINIHFVISKDYKIVLCELELTVLNTIINISVTVDNDIEFNEYNYEEFNDVPVDIVNKFIDLINNKNINIDFISKIKDLVINGNIYINLNDLSINGNINIDKYTIYITYIDNKIYCKFNNIRIYKELEINTDINLVSVIDLLLNGKFKDYVDLIEANNESFKVYFSDLINDIFDEEIYLLFNLEEDKINILSNLLNTQISLDNTEEKEILLDEVYYDISNLLDSLKIFKNINKDSYRFNYDMNLSYKDYLININGNIDLVLNEDKYDLVINLNIFNYDIKLIIDDNYLYLYLSNINIKIDLDNIDNIIEEIKNILIENEIELDIDNDILDSLLNNIYYENNVIRIDFDNIISIIGETLISFNGNNINIDSDLIDLDINYDKLEAYEINILDIDYLNEDDVINLIRNIMNSYKIIKNNDLEASFNISIYDYLFKHIEVTGIVNFHYYDNLAFDFKINGYITLYNDLDVEIIHYIDLLYLSNQTKELEDDYIYIVYTNSLDTSSKIGIKTSIYNINNIINDIDSLLDLGINKDINLDEIDFKSIIKNIGLENNILNINLNNVKSDNPIKIEYKYNEEIELKITDIYTKYLDEYNYTKLDIDYLNIINNNTEYNPLDINYFDISELHILTKAIVNTKNLSNISYSGTLKLKLFDVITALNLPVTLDMDLVNLKGHVSFDLSGVSTLELLAINKSKADLYFDPDFIYIRRQNMKSGLFGNTDLIEAKVSVNTFFDNLSYYLCDLTLGFKDLILNQINNSEKDGEINYSKIINNYKYDNNSFNFSIALNQLTGISAFGNLDFKLNLKEYDETLVIDSLTDVNLQVLSGLINVSTSGLSLSNVSDNSVTDIDLSGIISFIESYSYNPDLVYINGKLEFEQTHDITYVLGLDLDNIIQTGKYNDSLVLPELDYHVVNGITYKFMGYYLDNNFINELDIDSIGYSSMEIYAKWIKDIEI